MKRWTKVDIKAMTQAIASWFLYIRPLSGITPDDLAARVRETLDAHRGDIVIGGILEMRGIHAERAEKDRATVAHCKARPEVWGASTPEMIERFEKLAAEEDRAVAKADALIARIRAEGLPPEVVAFDPLKR